LVLASQLFGQALIRIERKTQEDRIFLLDHTVPIIAEFNESFLVLGEPTELVDRIQSMGFEVKMLDPDVKGYTYYQVGLRNGWVPQDLELCGEAIHYEENWAIVRQKGKSNEKCFESPYLMVAPIRLSILKPARPAPAVRRSPPQPRDVKPLVQQMVGEATSTLISNQWDFIIGGLNQPPDYGTYTTRNSNTAGCQTAVENVAARFREYGLDWELFDYGSYPPDAIGTLPGVVTPDNVFIVIGHIDDMPSSGAAPGANDNASGTATVTALAEVMSRYRFENTVKFLAVTGEEQGLHGSTAYSDRASTEGEAIQAVLNADMTGWDGGRPATENVNINYNASSLWLAQAMQQAVQDYATGSPVNLISCSSLTASDHAPFWADGYSAICGITNNEGYCVSGEPSYQTYYHTSNDTRANCGDPNFFYGAVRAYLATLADLAVPVCRIPDPPLSPTAVKNGDNRIDLTWTSSESGATFEVFRSPGGCSSDNPWTKIGETASTSFNDMDASGGVTYGYKIRVTDSTGFCTSNLGECSEGITTGSCYEPMVFKGIQSVTNSGSDPCALDLAWDDAVLFCGGSVSYTLYRSTVPEFTPDPSSLLISGIPFTSFRDMDDLAHNTTYYYIVHAVESVSGTEDNNVVEISGSPYGPGGGIQTLFSDGFETDTGWTVAGSGEWQRGTPQGLGGEHGNPDPSAAFAGSYVFGNDLSGTGTYPGDYEASLSATSITSPAIDCSSASNVQLSFQRYLNVEQPLYDGASIRVSTNGSTWNTVWSSSATITDSSWSLQTYDISTWADGQSTVYVRFQIDKSDTAWQYSGWNIDEVKIEGFIDADCTPGVVCYSNPLVNVVGDGPFTLCEGTDLLLSVNLSGGTGPFQYQWTRDGVDLPGEDGDTYTANNTGTHTYNCLVRSTGCSVDAYDPTPTTITWRTEPSFTGIQSVTNPGEATCSLDLTWSAATSYCGGPLVYRIYRSTSTPVVPGPSTLIATVAAPAVTYRDQADLVNGTPYYYLVRAEDNGVEDSNVVEHSDAPDGPGGGVQELFSDDFEDAGTWSQWTVTTGPGPHTCGPWSRVNSVDQLPASGSGYYALTNSDACGSGSTTSTILTSPSIDCSVPGLQTVTLSVAYYYNYYNGDDASIQVFNGSSWISVWNDSNTDEDSVLTDLDVTIHALAAGSDFRIRFSYQNASYDYWFAVDNILVEGLIANGCTTAASGPKSIPDGSMGTDPFTVVKTDMAGQTLELDWDATCTPDHVNVLYGNLASLSSYALQGSFCDLVSKSITVGTQTDLWMVLVSDDGSGTESSWGQAASGPRNGESASNQCGDSVRNNAGSCP